MLPTPQLMPPSPPAWSAWDYLTTCASTSDSAKQTVTLTYSMSILQALSSSTFSDILVTLSPETPPKSELRRATYHYGHQLCNSRAVAAQAQLKGLKGKQRIWYAGACTCFGFHEDGFASGTRVELRLGGDVPWEAANAKFSRGMKPVLGVKKCLVRGMLVVMQLGISLPEQVFGVCRSPAAALKPKLA